MSDNLLSKFTGGGWAIGAQLDAVTGNLRELLDAGIIVDGTIYLKLMPDGHIFLASPQEATHSMHLTSVSIGVGMMTDRNHWRVTEVPLSDVEKAEVAKNKLLLVERGEAA